ncbi:MAG: hypothetical protein Q4E70_03405 [Candidatus Saccharibacteria bacterium]|nr:hypothetical protein [Candidatus Saccharibacteria bacterium]
MDKEAPEITPTTLGGQGENAVKAIDSAAIKAASAEAKEKKEDYYVDPLEQDALMQKKQAEIEARRAATGVPTEEQAVTAETVEEADIRPDMNVTGYFSSGETAKKSSIMKQPASSGTMKIFFGISAISAGFSVIYLIILIATLYRAHWFMGWIYGVLFFLAIISVFFAVRSLNAMNDKIKKYAILDLVCTGISVIPLLMLLINMIFKIA